MTITDTNGNECTEREMSLVRENPAAPRLERVLSAPELVKLAKMVHTIDDFGVDQAMKAFPWLRYLGNDPKPRVEQALQEIRDDTKLRARLLAPRG